MLPPRPESAVSVAVHEGPDVPSLHDEPAGNSELQLGPVKPGVSAAAAPKAPADLPVTDTLGGCGQVPLPRVYSAACAIGHEGPRVSALPAGPAGNSGLQLGPVKPGVSAAAEPKAPADLPVTDTLGGCGQVPLPRVYSAACAIGHEGPRVSALPAGPAGTSGLPLACVTSVEPAAAGLKAPADLPVTAVLGGRGRVLPPRVDPAVSAIGHEGPGIVSPHACNSWLPLACVTSVPSAARLKAPADLLVSADVGGSGQVLLPHVDSAASAIGHEGPVAVPLHNVAPASAPCITVDPAVCTPVLQPPCPGAAGTRVASDPCNAVATAPAPCERVDPAVCTPVLQPPCPGAAGTRVASDPCNAVATAPAPCERVDPAVCTPVLQPPCPGAAGTRVASDPCNAVATAPAPCERVDPAVCTPVLQPPCPGAAGTRVASDPCNAVATAPAPCERVDPAVCTPVLQPPCPGAAGTRVASDPCNAVATAPAHCPSVALDPASAMLNLQPPRPLSAPVVHYLWGLPPYEGSVDPVDLHALSPSALTAWLTTEDRFSATHPNRVVLASSATTALVVPEVWRDLPPNLVTLIESAMAQWPLRHDVWCAAGFNARPRLAPAVESAEAWGPCVPPGCHPSPV